MKIGLCVPSWPPGASANGIVTYASQLVPALRRLGHEVFILTWRNSGTDPDAYTISLRRFEPKPRLWDRVMFRIVPETASFKAATSTIASAVTMLVEKHKLDVLEIEESFGWSFAISRQNLVPVVVRLHGPWFLNGRFDGPADGVAVMPRRQSFEKRGICHAHFVTSPSAEVLHAVKDRYAFALPASRVIPNPLKAASEAETWDETCSENSLLYVGRFDKRKGGDFILRVYAKLAASYPQLKLTFVGPDRGVAVAGGTTIKLDEFVRSTVPVSHQPQIEFLGQTNHSDVMLLRRKHAVTIVASQYEPFPYVVLEAMSCGCPLVATAVGGIPELIHDRRNGLLVSSQDVDGMAAACSELLDNRALAAQLGRQARQDCQQLYAPDDIAKRTVAAYEEAIEIFKRRKHSPV